MQSSKDIGSDAYLRLLVMGSPKVGKSYTILSTCEAPVYVINSDDKYALKPAAGVCQFDWELALGDKGPSGIQRCLVEIEKGVAEGKYKTVVWDTITKYAKRLEDWCLDQTRNAQGVEDGRRAYPPYHRHLRQTIDRLFKLKAHVIVTAHYVDVGGTEIDNQLEKSGKGIVPLLAGQSRALVPAEFQDVVFLEKRGDKRKFIMSAEGIWGPGCRNSIPGVSEVDANVREMWRMMNQANKTTQIKKEIRK